MPYKLPNKQILKGSKGWAILRSRCSSGSTKAQ